MDKNNVPDFVSNAEDVIRVLLTPIHIKKENELKPYTFRPPKNSQDISVNRRAFTDFDTCKKQGLKMEKEDKHFWGFGIISVQAIRDIGFQVVYSPNEHNIAHSDIQIGEITKEGQPLSDETNLKIKRLMSKTTLVLDPNPNTDNWF